MELGWRGSVEHVLGGREGGVVSSAGLQQQQVSFTRLHLLKGFQERDG